MNPENSEKISKLCSCGAELKGEKGTFRSPSSLSISAPLESKWKQGCRVEALSRKRERAFIGNISCAIILRNQGEADGVYEPNTNLFIWKHLKINSLPE